MALLLKTLLLLTGIVLVSGGAVQYSLNVYVDPDNGTNTTSCWTSNSPAQPCRNLSYALQYRSNSTRYVLQQATHYLDSTASDQPFRELNAVAITGNGSNVSVVCLEDAGLAFVSVENLLVANVTFSNCSAVQNSTSANFSLPNVDFELSLTRAAVYFSHCSNISFHNVTVTHSPGATGVIMYNTIGDNTFSGCTFSNNNNSNPLVYPGGGGVYVEFSYCLPGNTSCKNGTEESYTDHNKHSVYQFIDCNFFNNQAASFFSFFTPYRQNHVAFSPRRWLVHLFQCRFYW